MNKILIILRGISGSGKSTLARQLVGNGVIHSTDNYFLVDGKYCFDRTKLGRYHAFNKAAAIESMKNGITPVIIDNTNTTSGEAMGYVGPARQMGYEIKIFEPDTPWAFDVDELVKRTTHSVPRGSILEMLRRYEPLNRFVENLGMNYTSNKTLEFWQNFSQSDNPSQIFNELFDDLACDDIIKMLKETKQNPIWHPEGDVFEHTRQVIFCADKIAKREQLSTNDRFVLLMSALIHDFGKPLTTRYRMVKGENKLTSYNHEEAGAKIADVWLESFGVDTIIKSKIINLVRYHLGYMNFTDRSVVKIAEKLQPTTIKMLMLLCEADGSGRCANFNDITFGLSAQVKAFCTSAMEQNVYESYTPKLKPILAGKDILEKFPNIDKKIIGALIQETKMFDSVEEALLYIIMKLQEEKGEN